MKSSPLSQHLLDFSRGLISRDALEDRLEGKVRFHFWDTNQRSSDLVTKLPKVEFTKEDVDAQLRRFLSGELTARDLSDWGATIRLLGCFQLNLEDPASSAVWDIIDELMSPDVWEPLTVEVVISLRRRLAEVVDMG